MGNGGSKQSTEQPVLSPETPGGLMGKVGQIARVQGITEGGGGRRRGAAPKIPSHNVKANAEDLSFIEVSLTATDPLAPCASSSVFVTHQ